jgi:thiol-disulfide isomerase/thioredoxin
MTSTSCALIYTLTSRKPWLKSTTKGLQIENKFNSISVLRIDGSSFSTAPLQGKPCLVIFGATWCKPCKDNYHLIKSLYAKYKSQNLEVVAINLDERKDKWLEQIKSCQLEWINISELKTLAESKIAKYFNISAIPITFW